MPRQRPAVTAYFSHPDSYVGDLVIENGLDQAHWGYNLNTQSFSTYGGEVVQILSVNIGDVTLGGSITTYRQAQLIYGYFARYFQIATQGTPLSSGESGVSSGYSYNQQAMTFNYPMRDWSFQIQPKTAPGFRYDVELVNPIWVMTAHVVDSNNQGSGLATIKAAIKAAASNAGNGISGDSGIFNSATSTLSPLSDQISPNSGNPNSDPFQTFNKSAQQAESALGSLSDYYSSLVSSFQNNNYQSITGGVGSKPAQPKASKAKSGYQITDKARLAHG